MSGICPQCGRDYSSQSTTCRFCNCALIDRKSYSSYQQSAKQSAQKTNQQKIQKPGTTSQVESRQNSSTYFTNKKPTKKNKFSFISLIASGIFCLIAVTALSDMNTKKSETKNRTSNTNIIESQSETSSEIINESSGNSSKEDSLRKSIEDVIGEESLEVFTYVPENNYCSIKFRGTSKYSLEKDILDILEAIQPIIDTDVNFRVNLFLNDIYGNKNDYTIIQATFTNDTIKKINYENALSSNLRYLADEWWNDDYLE